MILAGVFRRCTFSADGFPGEPDRRTVQSITASIALAGSPGYRITENHFVQSSLTVQPDQRIAPARV